MSDQQYQHIVSEFKRKKILVAGDIMLDLYVRGEVERISPEAPVPVVIERTQEYLLGGAGNVAMNIAALGAKVTLLGVTGNDEESIVVQEIARHAGMSAKIVKEAGRPTAVKTRIIAGQYQLLRVDRERTGEYAAATYGALERTIKGLPDYDCVVVPDYVKGFAIPRTIAALRNRFGSENIIANIKPRSHVAQYKGIGVITLNAKEGYELCGISSVKDADAARAATALSKLFGVSVVLTRGEHGMTVYDRRTKKAEHISSVALHVFDVTGAGDTVIAVLALMLASGAALREAAWAANKAAGIVVAMPGTAVVGPEALAEQFRS